MSKNKKFSLKFIQNIDMFGKEPGLYYKGNDKKNTWYGTTVSIMYITIYVAYCIYKIFRMLKKKDVTYFDSFDYLEDPPTIELTIDKFYGGFALEHPITHDQYIDETIYYPKAFFKTQIRNGENWDIETKELELVQCKVEYFGKDFQDSVIDSIENLYCFKGMNETLAGSFSYDTYSYFYIEFFPCKNSTENGNHCKTKEELDFYLMNTFVCFELQDIQLTPLVYDKPIRGRNNDIYYTVGKKLFQEVHIFYQLVDIQTDLDLIGFDEFPNFKHESYIKYDWDYQMSSLLENDIYETGEAFCSASIKLDDEVRIETRSYTKILTLLSDVGGLMEVVLSFFKIISSFSINIIYDKSIVNNLFDFDLDRKVIMIKNDKDKEKNKLNIIGLNQEQKSRNDPTQFETKKKLKKKKIYDNKLTIENKALMNGIKTSKAEEIISPKKKKIKKKIKIKNISSRINLKNTKKHIYTNNFDNNENNKIEIYRTDTKDNKRASIIKRLKMNKCCTYFCCFCESKRKTIENVLLKEGMNLFTEKMDILRLFKKLLNEEKIKLEPYNISDEGKIYIKKLNLNID